MKKREKNRTCELLEQEQDAEERGAASSFRNSPCPRASMSHDALLLILIQSADRHHDSLQDFLSRDHQMRVQKQT
ncbi:hypothetical protein F7725_020002 [Dissostichus mawsoni]|uniref:Uncharacterized protein n=1 Tax=Dissostichus mawsoni TaxID=36200 RepID=A0A7J5YM99_DISMA|nr:hypothetical protein F7725_020002 [Dissostichus mawsoni]